MNLVTTTQELQIVLGEAKTTSDCDITASFGDFSGNNFMLIENDATSNGTTPVVVVSSPAFETQRQVKEIRLFNNDTVAHTVTLQLFDGTTTWVVQQSLPPVPPGGSFIYTPENGARPGAVTEIVAGAGLDGGTIVSVGTISLGTIAANELLGNSGTIAAVPTGVAIGANLLLAAGTLSATGSIAASITIGADSLYGNPTGAPALGVDIAIGPNLTLSAGGTLSASAPGAGSVTSIVAGSNLNVGAGPGGTITASGTLNLQNSPTISVTNILPMVLNANTAVPALSAPVQFEIVASDLKGGGPVVMQMYGYRGNGGTLRGLASGGQLSAPTAIVASTLLWSLEGRGYDGSAMSLSNVSILEYASQNWSPTSHPTAILFQVTPAGSTLPAVAAMTIQDSNIVTIGTTVPTGTENLQVVGGLATDNLNVSGTLAAFPIGGSLSIVAGVLEAPAPGVGTVTQVVAGSNLTGGTITNSGTIALQASPTIAVTTQTLPLIINANTAIPAAANTVAGGNLALVGADATRNVLTMFAYASGNTNMLQARQARGTEATPTATQATDKLFQMQGIGYNGTAFSGSAGALALQAMENFTTAATGTAWIFSPVQQGTTIVVGTAFQVQADSSGPHTLIGTATTIAAGGALQVVGGISTDTLKVGGVAVLPTLSGTTGSIGGSPLLAGADATGTVAVAGATTGMAVAVSPVTYPGAGFFWEGYVSSPGTVTVAVGAVIAGTPGASAYNVRVLQ